MKTLGDSMATGIQLESYKEIMPCEPCIKGKHHRNPFPKEGTRASEQLELIHSDLCGPMETTSAGGSRYFLSFIDNSTRKVFIFFLKDKSEVAETFEEFRSSVERQTSKKICILRSDNGREYINRSMDQNLRRLDIMYQKTIPYTPEQNGLAERMNRTIVERAKAMLFDAELPKIYWAEAVATATYLINRSPAAGLKGKTPEEAWTGQRPDLKHLRVFGCKAYIHVSKSQRLKWDPKAEEMLFVGYSGFERISVNGSENAQSSAH